MNQRKRVALLCQHFYPEMISTGMHMTELALGLGKLGWEIVVYCAQPSLSLDSENPEVPEEMKYHGIKILRVSSIGSHSRGFIWRLFSAMSYLASSAFITFRKHREYDVLLITTNPPFLGLVGKLVNWVFKKPYILIVYDVYPDIVIKLDLLKPVSPLVWIWDKIARLVMNGAAENVVIGRDMAEVVGTKLRVANRQKVQLIPNWSDENTVHPVPSERNPFRKEHLLEGYWVVQYAGRMGITHNLEPLIEAAEILAGKSIIFQFIGDGAKKKALKEITEEKNLSNVQILPYQPLSKLAQVLSAADVSVVCLGSIFTGLSVPSKTYGVMASGTPLLGFLDPGSEIGRTILENNCGVVLSDPTGSEVAQVIEELMSNPQQAKEMGANGYLAFKDNYTLAHAAKRYSDLLESVLNRPYAES